MAPPPSAGTSYPTERDGRRLGYPAGPRHSAWVPAFGDMVECPGGCGKPIVRRLRDRAPFDLTHTPHRCPGPVTGEEDAYRRALAEAHELGVWPWTRGQWQRHQEAERERIREQDEENERLEAERWRERP